MIDEDALVRAMESGRVSRCGLDVYEREPMVHPYLMKSDRATLLPVCTTDAFGIDQMLTIVPQHWGTSTTRTIVDAEKEGLANIVSYLNRGVPNTPVNDPFNDFSD